MVRAQVDQEYNYEFALIEANRQKSIGNINEAVNLYKKCLSVKPESGIAAYELGSIYIALNNADLAYKYFKEAYLSDKENYWYMVAYIEILKLRKKNKEAEEIILDYLKMKDDSKLRYSLVGIYEETEKYKKALKHLNHIELKNGLSETVILKKVDIYKRQKKYNEGEKELFKLKDMVPESADYYIFLAEYLNETGQKDRASGFFLQAYLLDTTNLYAVTNLADYYIQNKNFNKGFAYLKKAFKDPKIKLENKIKTIIYYLDNLDFMLKYHSEIEQIISSLLVLYPTENIVSRVAYDFYFKVENYEQSYLQIKKLLKEENENYPLWQQAIYNASLLGLSNDIIELGNEAISYFPNKTDLYLFIGIGYFQKNDFEKAYNILKENYQLGLEIDLQIQFLTFLAESAYKLEYNEEAFSYFEELILLDPQNFPILNNYSYYLSLEGINLDRAEKLSYKTIIRNPESAVYLDTYGWILFKQNRTKEAIEYLEKAIALSDDPDILFHYAEALFKFGEKQKAGEYYKKALDEGYDSGIIKPKLELCY